MPARAKKSWPRRYFDSFNFLGLIFGTIFVNLSFLPSLLPRGWVLQAVLSAILFCIGYGIGLIVSSLIRAFSPKEPTKPKKKQIKKITYLVLIASYLAFIYLGINWQDEINRLVEQEPKSPFLIVPMILLTDLLIVLIILTNRSIRSLFKWLRKLALRILPRAVAYSLAWAVTFLLVIGIVNGFILENTMNAVNSAFSVKNGTTDEGINKPSSAELSGSDSSLISWDTLGRQGRKFIGKTQTAEQISEFSGTQAINPVRIYAGLESAGNAQERASLAVNDLKRAGGFERQIIAVVTTTGTGWVDENGVDPLEYMYNGNSAIVSMQYSYLPSWLSFLVDQSKAKEAGLELYNAVYNEWLNLPPENRPKIVVFGESLGSFGSETAFASESAFKATSDGAVWVGPPNFNNLWRKSVNDRDSGSPEILPIVDGGKTIRFAARPADLNNLPAEWQSPKAVYLQNPSDPIVWWSPKLLYKKPDWLNETRGFDVSVATRWLPIITFWQVSGDMVFSTGVPDGHGHKYGTLPTDAWAQVAPPTGWTQQQTEALKITLMR